MVHDENIEENFLAQN